MDNRSFNSVMHFFNEKWAAEATGMNVNPGKGPDLISDDKIIEVKFKVVYPNEYMHISWRVLEYQMNYNQDEQGRKAYWGLGIYTLKKHVSDIKLRSIKDLEMLVLTRSLSVVPWDWMTQFPAYRQKGKTEYSEWDNTLRFPKGRLLPKIVHSYKVLGGEVNLTEGVNPNNFSVSLS